jgi:enoyl-CoA hydratase/carnithine racemase
MEKKYFTVTYENYIAEVILNNPKRFNMLSLAFAAELEEIFISLESNDAVRSLHQTYYVCLSSSSQQ